MLTLSPHPYVPTGATTLALALLFGIGIFFGTGRDAKRREEKVRRGLGWPYVPTLVLN